MSDGGHDVPSVLRASAGRARSVAVWLLLVCGVAQAAEFRVAPYLLDVTRDEATVAFHLSEPLSAQVRVFGGATESGAFAAPAARSHFVRVSGLASGSTYRYEVVCGDGRLRTPPGDASYEIRTACRPGESFSFVAYGDPRPSETRTHRYHEQIVAQIAQHDPVFALVLGDMVDDGRDPALWRGFFGVESAVARRTALFPVLGDNDHVAGSGAVAAFFPALKRGYYRFEWGGIYFFGLRAWDTRGRQPASEFDGTSAQVQWLESELSSAAAQEAPFRIVFTHDPVLISRGRAAELLHREWSRLFEQYRVDLVFASWHMYERSQRHGVHYVISGGAGAELIFQQPNPAYAAIVDAKRHHFCRIDVAGSSLRLRAIDMDGTVFDELVLQPRAARAVDGPRLGRLAARLRREYRFDGGEAAPELTLHLFSSECPFCRRLLGGLLAEYAETCGVSLRVQYYDLADNGAYDLLLAAESDFGRHGVEIPAVFVGRTVLAGEQETLNGLEKELGRFRADPARFAARSVPLFAAGYDPPALRRQRARRDTGSACFKAGLRTGLSACGLISVAILVCCLGFAAWGSQHVPVLALVPAFAAGAAQLLIGLFLAGAVSRLPFRAELRVALCVMLLACMGWLAFRDLRGVLALLRDSSSGHGTRAAAGRRLRRMVLGVGCLAMCAAGLVQYDCQDAAYLSLVALLSDPRLRAGAAAGMLLHTLGAVLPVLAVAVFAVFVSRITNSRGAGPHAVAVTASAWLLLVVALCVVMGYNLIDL